MSETQNSKISLGDAIDYLNAVRKQYIRRLTVVRTLWIGLLLAILFFYLDAVIILSGSNRMVLGIGFLVVITVLFLFSPKFMNRTKNREKMLARMIESKHPDLDNVLVNAIDFDQSIKEQKTKNVSESLMKREINLAIDKFGEMETVEGLELPTMKTESWILAATVAMSLVFVVAFYNMFISEIPRFLDPFGDHPPYSPTKFVVEPAGTIIDYGSDLEINVTAKGKIPENVTLAFQSSDGDILNEVGMFNTGDGQFSQTIEDVTTEMVYYAGIKRARSKYYKIELSKTPRIEQVLADYKFPEYTHIPGKTAVLSKQEGHLKGYEGTQITMTVQSNRPLAGGTVTVGDKQYKFEPDKENTVKGSFPLLDNSEYSVLLKDIEGNISTDKFAGNIEIIPDGEPYVTIVNPGMNSFAIPSAIIPIIIEAYDDLGVQDVSIIRSHNDSDDYTKLLSDPNERGEYAQVRVVEMFDLGDLGLKPGDTIEYYALATDAVPGKPQTAASESFRIEIVSEQEYSQSMQERMDAEALEQKYEEIIAQIEELIDLQKELEQQTSELQEEMANGADPNSREIQDKLKQLAKKQSELGEKTEELSKKLVEESEAPPVFDIEKEYKEMLADIAGRLDNAQEHMENSADKMNESSESQSGNLGLLGMANEEQNKALEEMGQQTQAMRDSIREANNEIAQMYKLMEDVSNFQQLYEAQKNLAKQTKTLSQVQEPDLDTQIRLKELADEQNAVKDELEQLAEQLREHGQEVEEKYPDVAKDAQAIAQEIEMRQIPSLMQESRDSLNQNDSKSGHQKAQEAYEQMEAMIQFCQACSSSGGGQCALRLKLMMMLNPGNTMNQLAQSLGLNMGMGMGEGMMGAFGRGAAGNGGGYSQYAMFGGDTFGRDHLRQSPFISARPRHKFTDMVQESILSRQLSGNIEELSRQDEKENEFEAEGQNKMMAEYNRLIEAYFQRLAEDK
ncbi:MAG: hypothetical protein JXA96_11645 [Sedimentisphaerales bacterium]|nr:hypothetical protein [Sedimentisphaerales bacterium]